jgi:predicted XRE-type DNA-binding protein
MPKTKGMHFEESSGNVFADLGLPDAEEHLVKAQLAIEIGRILKRRKLTQQAAAELMGIDQPKVSHLLHGRLGGYSTERLLHFLTALGRDVEIVLRTPPRSRRHGRLRVVA